MDVSQGLSQISHVTETLQPSRRQVTVAMPTPARKGIDTVTKTLLLRGNFFKKTQNFVAKRLLLRHVM